MHLPYSEFYITNVCNLNCTNCNRFNNFAFSGHQLWNDHADTYKKWANLLDIDTIGIIGGEPMLNPDFMSWVTGVRELWPNSELRIITNGTQLSRYPELYDLIVANADKMLVEISFHGFGQKEKVIPNIMTWLQQPVVKTTIHNKHTNELWQTIWNKIKDSSWPACNTPQDFVNLPGWIQQECIRDHRFSLTIWEEEVCHNLYCDANGVRVNVNMANYFNDSTVLFNPATQKLTLNNSNPALALEACYSKKCHHFIRGHLYKCGPVGILPEFIEQFDVEMSSEDRALINAYTPADTSWSPEQLSAFIDNLNNVQVIPQCKFCPENTAPKLFEAGVKKIKLTKIS